MTRFASPTLSNGVGTAIRVYALSRFQDLPQAVSSASLRFKSKSVDTF